jgi:hypothetical protein
MLNCKKLLSMALACAMAATLAVPAFAATTSESTTNRSLKVTGAYQAVTISVVVPSTGTVIIDPYKLPVEIYKDTETTIKSDGLQIVTKPLAIKNQSDIKLDMNISATTTVTGTLTLATGELTDIKTEKKNSAYVYLEAQVAEDLSGDPSEAVSNAKVAQAYKDFTWAALVTDEGDTQNGIVLKSGSAQSVNGIVTLEPNTFVDDAFSTYAAGSIAFLKLDGNCAQNPTTAWATKDGLTCTIAFTFTPAETETDSSGSNT